MNLHVYCPVMAKYPVPKVKASAHIEAAPDEVFKLIADTRNDPLWCPNVDSAEIIEGREIAVGTRFKFSQHLERPRRSRLEFDAEAEILELGNRSITWHVTDRFQERVVEMKVTEEGSGSRVYQTTRASFHRSPGIGKWAYPLVARRTFKHQFRQLAAYCEERAQ